MKFTKEFLFDKMDEGYVDSGISGKSRWALERWGVFEHEGKFYRTYYRTAATEQQDEQPYDYDDKEIECEEVVKSVVPGWLVAG